MRLIRAISWVLTFVAIGAAAAAWFTPRVTDDRAGDVAIDALAAAGIEDAAVDRTQPGTYVPTTTVPENSDGGAEGDDATTTTSGEGTSTNLAEEGADDGERAYDVWVVNVSSGDEVIEMRVHKTNGQLVYVDDAIGENRDRRLLTDEEWDVVKSYDSGGIDPWKRRNAVSSGAALLIVVVGFVLARRTGDLG